MLVVNDEALPVCLVSLATQVVYKFRKKEKMLPLSLESCALVLYLMIETVCYFYEMCNDVKV